MGLMVWSTRKEPCGWRSQQALVPSKVIGELSVCCRPMGRLKGERTWCMQEQMAKMPEHSAGAQPRTDNGSGGRGGRVDTQDRQALQSHTLERLQILTKEQWERWHTPGSQEAESGGSLGV